MKRNIKEIKKEKCESLVEKAQEGDMKAAEELIRMFSDEIAIKAASYYIIGGESQDVMQEAMIGLYKAVKTYRKDGGAGFATYANVCMTRQILTAIRSASREKHEPLNSFVSINSVIEGVENHKGWTGKTIEETIPGNITADADTILVLADIFDYVENSRKVFSKLEKEVWKQYIEGKSYNEISENLGRNIKSVYNTMERVKKKILQYLNQ